MPAKRKTYTRKQMGGDSAAYGFGPAVSAGAPYASSVIAKEACMAEPRPGMLTGYSAGSGGLPGFAGGGRKQKRKQRKFSFAKWWKSTRKMFGKGRSGSKRKAQRGGRYTFDVGSPIGSSGPNVFTPVSHAGCEGGMVNTLPPSIQHGGVGTVASPFYSASTAAYGNDASTWRSMVGTPSLVQTPYQVNHLNPACIKTAGGGRRNKRSSRKYRH